MTKPAIYAEQGIPYLWRIDGLGDGAPRLQTYRLDAGGYLLHGDLGPGERGPVAASWPVAVDMAEFVMPHKR